MTENEAISIDEAIEHSMEVANDKRADADWKWRHGRLNSDDCISCAEQHEQLAEWLEELKQYRAIGTIDEFKALKENNTPKNVRNKAIDELTEESMKRFTELELKDSLVTATDFKVILRDVAEQLKGGAV